MTVMTEKPMRIVLVLAAVLLVASMVLAGPVGAQSGGCEGGPFPGATPTDSDGDGASDAEEILAGTDECDPTSVVAGSAANTQPPVLALTGPSRGIVLAYAGLVLVTFGVSSLVIGRRVDA